MIEIDAKTFKEAINEVAATDSGKLVFAYLKDICQWDETYLSSESPELTHFFAAKRGVYGGIRKLIKNEYLKDIEFNYKRKIDDRGSDKPSRGAKVRSQGVRTSKESGFIR